MPVNQPDFVLQIATPFSTGTGCYLPQFNLVVTNEHIVRDNPTVLVAGKGMEKQLMKVVYLDAYYDLAFLRPESPLAAGQLNLQPVLPTVGDTVMALGHNYGQRRQESTGEVTDPQRVLHDINYIQHTARLESAQSGGPLIGAQGELLGVNMYDIDEGHQLALSLPAKILLDCVQEFVTGEGKGAVRCFECGKLSFENPNEETKYCTNCGTAITLPNDVPEYQPSGVQATVEQIVIEAGHDPRMARRGPNLWEIAQGSARIQIAYHEDSGLVTGDAHLCLVPDDHPASLFEYLLRQNCELEHLTFSTRGRDIILSLLIYDRYLSAETALPQFQHLFKMADRYD
ncbi:MAG: serine protease, partial [Bacteroidota bacterium]